MGDTKSQMTGNTDKAKSLFGTIMSKKKKSDDAQPQTFADKLAEIDTDLEKIILNKEAEFKNEKGQEDKNRVALGRLRTMRFHLDEMINAAAEYAKS